MAEDLIGPCPGARGRERYIHIWRKWRKTRGFQPIPASRPRPGISTDADGSERPAIFDSTRGPASVAEEDARRGVGPARRHRYSGDRQLYRAAEALYRG